MQDGKNNSKAGTDAGVFYDLWFDSYKDFKDHMKEATGLVYVPVEQRAFIDQQLNSACLESVMNDKLSGVVEAKRKYGYVPDLSLFSIEQDIKSILERCFSDYMMRVSEAGGDVREASKTWRDNTNDVLARVKGNPDYEGHLVKDNVDSLVDMCIKEVNIMAFDVWGRPDKDGTPDGKAEPEATTTDKDSFESIINPASGVTASKLYDALDREYIHLHRGRGDGRGRSMALVLEALYRLGVLSRRAKWSQVGPYLDERKYRPEFAMSDKLFYRYYPSSEDYMKLKLKDKKFESELSHVMDDLRKKLKIQQ